MSVVQLGELMASKVPSLNPALFKDELFEMWSIPAFDRGQPDLSLGAEIGSSKKSIQPGDVLLSRIVPHIRRAWVVKPSASKCRQIGSGEWIVFRSKKFDPDYLRHFLISDPFHSQFMQTVAGVGGSLLRARPDGVAEIELTLPPLEEQKRIAAILDQADALRRKRQRALDRLNQLGQAIFVEMFGNLIQNEKAWPVGGTLGDHAEIASGITKGRDPKGRPTRLVPYLAVVNVQDKRLQLDAPKEIEATEDEIMRYRLQPGDLLLTEGGDPDKLGRGTLWNGELHECIHQNHVFRVRLSSKQYNPTFLNWIVGSAYGKKYFLRAAKQTTGIASINMSQLKAFPLLLPPIELQDDFKRRLDQQGSGTEKFAIAARFTEDLFTSLQHRAFRGEL